MVESKEEHDVLNKTLTAFVGDDTGLLKQVKITAKCTVVSHGLSYGAKKRMKTVVDENGNKQEVEARPGKLNPEDNQLRNEYESSVKFKLMGKYGEQVKNTGVQSLSYTLGSLGEYLSFLKGTSNRACIFNTTNEVVSHSKDYTELFDRVDATLKSIHPLPLSDDSAKTVKHVLISDKGHICIDTIAIKKLPKKQQLCKIAGDQVWKTF